MLKTDKGLTASQDQLKVFCEIWESSLLTKYLVIANSCVWKFTMNDLNLLSYNDLSTESSLASL